MRKPPFPVPENKKIRVMIDTDAGCEADDQFAIAHALMSVKLEVVGILAEHFGHLEGSMEQSYEQVQMILHAMEEQTVPVWKGAERPLENDRDPESSAASRFLVQEALKPDPRPLYILCQGALTNEACAIMENPEIQNRIQLIIVGGCNYPYGGYEFNTMNDPQAFNVIMNSQVPVWMIPEEVYAAMQVGLMELKQRTKSCGEVGTCLYERTLQSVVNLAKRIPEDPSVPTFEAAVSFPNGESWSLGDSAVLGPLLMHHAGSWKEVTAPNVCPDGTYCIADGSRKIRWYTSIDRRFLIEDFFAKLLYYFGTVK